MIYGIVGNEGAKFTAASEAAARRIIRGYIRLDATEIVSGACHLGGIDVWAIEEAKLAGLPWREFPPKTHRWDDGYKPRNIEIAAACDVLVNIVVGSYPETYHGMRFGHCYHCITNSHIKSGGCWTLKYAKRLKKRGYLHVV